MGQVLSTTRAELREVSPSLRKAQLVVRSAANFISIVVVLSVVLPEADRTDLEPASCRKAEETATRTRIQLVSLGSMSAYELHPHTVTSS
jgi:hypothetical protein